jgi:hypothetical protein
MEALQAQYAALEKEERKLHARIESDAIRREALDNLYVFSKTVMGFKDLYEPLHRPLCDLIQNQQIARRLILLPRGHFKTSVISIAYPLWCLARNQNSRIALCSRAAHKAEENLEELIARAHYPRFQLLFGDIVGHPDQWPVCRRDKIRIPRRGATTGPSVAAYSTESSEVGRHFDQMLLDDIVDNDNTNTQDSRDKVWTWFGRQLSVLDPGSILTVVGTRWHWDDPYSRIQKQLAKFEEDKEVGWYVMKRKAIEKGKVLFPGRFSRKKLDEYRKVQGDYIFSCFYMNEPVGEGMNPFDLRKMKWVDYKKPDRNAWTYVLVDPASTKEDYSSYTGIVIGDAMTTPQGQRFVVREALLEKMHPDQVVDTIFDLVAKYSPYKVIIEDEGFQKSLYYWCRREMLMRGVSFNQQLVKNPRNLVQPMRLLALQPYVNNQVVVFDRNMPGKDVMMEEFETYPKGPHKDLICALYFITHAFFPSRHRVKKEDEAPPLRSRLITEMCRRRRRHGRMPNIRIGSVR